MEESLTFEDAKVLISRPEVKTSKVIIFIPGMSGGARTERFLPLVQIALRNQYAIARVDMWDSGATFNRLTIKRINTLLHKVVDYFMEEGFSDLVMIGKSFGGGLALQFSDSFVKKKILWAPGFQYQKIGTYENVKDKPFEEIISSPGITLGDKFLETVSVPVHFIHGTDDVTVLPQNSENLSTHIARGSVVLVPGADHSFKSSESEASLMKITEELIQLPI